MYQVRFEQTSCPRVCVTTHQFQIRHAVKHFIFSYFKFYNRFLSFYCVCQECRPQEEVCCRRREIWTKIKLRREMKLIARCQHHHIATFFSLSFCFVYSRYGCNGADTISSADTQIRTTLASSLFAFGTKLLKIVSHTKCYGMDSNVDESVWVCVRERHRERICAWGFLPAILIVFNSVRDILRELETQRSIRDNDTK